MSVDLQRRAFFMTGKVKDVNSDIHLPWLKSAEHFLDKCTQCQACLEHCPETIIEKGQGGYPTVNFTLGECTYCQACANHCPENLFDLDQSSPWLLKHNISDKCFTEHGIVCQSCRDVCEPQAISFKYVHAAIPKPELDTSLCNSCGACVSSCPANAISLKPDQLAPTENANE
jgi:ferredoxin-type protein NapF